MYQAIYNLPDILGEVQRDGERDTFPCHPINLQREWCGEL